MNYGFFRVACASPKVTVADCETNANEIIKYCFTAHSDGAELIVFPELSITGYTCGDLFLQRTLLDNAKRQLKRIAKETTSLDILIAVGCPLEKNDKLYNCGVFIAGGIILASIPKTHIPNYGEFYEIRHFTSGKALKDETERSDSFAFGTNTLIQFHGVQIACEICEDMWVPCPPSTQHVQAGAQIICNLSASNEVVGKADYRRMLVKSQSGRCACAYLYSNASHGESTQDLIFSGHNIIAEDGSILKESTMYNTGYILSDIDIDKLETERRRANTWVTENTKINYQKIIYENIAADNENLVQLDKKTKNNTNLSYTLLRTISQSPFVPADKENRAIRCSEIIAMQAEGLAKRLKHIGCKNAVIGLSGGLDSTLALLVTAEAFKRLKLDLKGIIAVTMPCFGTTDRTYSNACSMAKSMNVTLREIRIEKAVRQHFADIGQDENDHSVTYENSQARERTQVLMDLANKNGAIVIGTGDLSELALGWATYNGDHMSMYGVNSSIPKTLVRYLVAWFAEEADTNNNASQAVNKKLSDVLWDILDTPVSPELLPPQNDGTIAQKTEDLVGPYELHDFFLYYVLRWGYTPRKIYILAKQAFGTNTPNSIYNSETIIKWMRTFYKRFFQQQFKRSCMPDGIKVGTVNLSPRGDWRMPSDASAALWLKEVDTL
ncbi:MAG: NAD(+) synthase [Treponema sp. CETP13]|nr:MAG: NAD(+) synthase [Treponema sp. CETP13]